MEELRRNEFIYMLKIAEILYEENEDFLTFILQDRGSCNYYPLYDKLVICKNNSIKEHGFMYVKNFLRMSSKNSNLQNTIKIDQHYIDEATSLIKVREVKSEEELRDEFAGLALSGIMSIGTLNHQHQFDNIAENAYRLADAMINQKNKKL